jgi:hypothetical protein
MAKRLQLENRPTELLEAARKTFNKREATVTMAAFTTAAVTTAAVITAAVTTAAVKQQQLQQR